MKNLNDYITEASNDKEKILDILKNQISDKKAHVENDNAKGRFVITISDKKFERGFKEITVGSDMNNEIFVNNDWKNSCYSIKIDKDFQDELVKYCEENIKK